MTSLVGETSRTQTPGPERHEERTVSFPELVHTRFCWRKAVMNPSAGHDPNAAGEAYFAALATFERVHGRVVNAYWCSEIEAAVALTEKPRSRRARFRSPIRRFHRVSDYATRAEPDIARLMHQCDELAIRAIEVLSGRNERICMQLVMASAGQLLSLVDRPAPGENEMRKAVVLQDHDFCGAQNYYRQTANGEAQLLYFRGMVLGLVLLGGLYLAMLALGFNVDGVNEANIVGCLTAGAVGALVSVIARINTGSFALDFDIAPRYTLFLGGLRPWIGSIFGLAIYFAITSGFLDLFKVPGENPERFYFLCIIAFLAGFSERWAQDTLTGGLTKRPGATATGPPAADAENPRKPEAGAK